MQGLCDVGFELEFMKITVWINCGFRDISTLPWLCNGRCIISTVEIVPLIAGGNLRLALVISIIHRSTQFRWQEACTNTPKHKDRRAC